MTSRQSFDEVRHRSGFRCAYCLVHEEEVGALLEVDHFQPRSAGGLETPENLVYCCPACNRYKGDFWANEDQRVAGNHLLHPLLDNIGDHLGEDEAGHLMGLTPTGVFHIDRLHLNRPALVVLRRRRLRRILQEDSFADLQPRILRVLGEFSELQEREMRAMEPLAEGLREFLRLWAAEEE